MKKAYKDFAPLIWICVAVLALFAFLGIKENVDKPTTCFIEEVW